MRMTWSGVPGLPGVRAGCVPSHAHVSPYPRQTFLDACAQVEPPGMHMFYLPSKDDIRMPETNPKVTGGEWARADEDQARRRRLTIASSCARRQRSVPASQGAATCLSLM